ncbi:MAG: M20 family metallopeptidase [Thermoguttaceae bacterium]|jgi:acetylornithine deacetylase|nr:M20 family metallopeptidase [Thermoguttaceae bacterium]
MPLDPIEILHELVAIPSVNPMGEGPMGADGPEAKLTSYLERLFNRLGAACFRQPAEPGRDNLVARFDGEVAAKNGGRLVLLGVHQDTVPTTGMTIPPWTPTVRDGRLYGRGACDIKGGMAAMLAAVSRLVEGPSTGRPSVVVACTVNEEYGFSGVKALCRLWAQEPAFLPRKPDLAVVAEPTELQVVVAHKGVLRWRCHARGKAAHSSRPETGDNAIYKMARAVLAIQRYQNEVVAGLGTHPLCGPATVSVGTIRGGVSVNTVPDRCTIEIDRRLAPSEKPQEAYRHLVSYLARHAGTSDPLEHDPPYMEGLPLSDEANSALADRLCGVAREVIGNCRKIGVPYATDGAFLAAAGIPTVVFGPGSIAQAHTADEWIALEQVKQAADIYHRFLRGVA